MKITKQKQRKSIPVFAPWATISKPFTYEKHYINGESICYDVKKNEEYANHIETAGFFCSSIISYGSDKKGRLRSMYHVVFPTLRLYPNITRSSLDHNFERIAVRVNGDSVKEKADRFVFDGILHIFSHADDIEIERSVCSARNSKACIERITLRNTGADDAQIELVNKNDEILTDAKYGVDFKRYRIFVRLDKSRITLKSGESENVFIAYCAANEDEFFTVDCQAEMNARKRFISEISEKFIVETPDKYLNLMSRYAKIRACESIFMTKSGLMHSPGGGGYYAALWTNDQCEYVNPVFANIGYETGVDEALNCYELYKKYISPEKPLITSIISEGDGFWNGAKDRGDGAMYAYGCARFLLSLGSKPYAEKYIDAIRDCIAFIISQINEDGVIKSDSDELENRFESGNANLCTSCLAYDAFISTAYLEKSLGNEENSVALSDRAEKLRINIEKYFGKSVEGFDTYMYCKEETNLRSWITMPLVVGINDRAEATADALLSPKLRKNEGLITRSGEKTFWDRSTLYSLRGLFFSGFADKAIELLETYSKARLVGEHIPYAVEAFPEGNQAHLSAESGLYLRIFSEGILGYRPTGLDSFSLTPHLPEKWDSISVKNIFVCGKNADIHVKRISDGYEMKIVTGNGEKIFSGTTVQINM